MPALRTACTVAAVAPLAVLVLPGQAHAHSRSATVALGYRLHVSEATRALRGVRVSILDGDRQIRIQAAPTVRLELCGYLGEPMLRFDRDGVWVDARSVTAAANRLVPRGARSWTRITAAHAFAWHDHRLSPPPNLDAGARVRWSFPATLDGRRTAIAGTFERVPRPNLPGWLVLAVVVAGASAAAAVRYPRLRVAITLLTAVCASSAAASASVSFALADPLTTGAGWFETGVIVAVATVVLARAVTRRGGIWIAILAACAAFAFSLSAVGVLWHGVVVSSLPPTLVRALVTVALAGGAAAAVVGVTADVADEVPSLRALEQGPRRR